MTQYLSSNKLYSAIHQILIDENLQNDQKIDKLIALLQKENNLELHSFQLIDRLLKGLYGCEYLLIQKNYQKMIEFYQFLQNKFREIPEILLALSDLFLLNHQYSDSFDSFNQVFEKQPLLIFEAPGELYEMLEEHGNDQQKIFYHLSLVRAFIEDQELEDAKDEYEEVIQKYGNNNRIIKNYLEKNNLSSIF